MKFFRFTERGTREEVLISVQQILCVRSDRDGCEIVLVGGARLYTASRIDEVRKAIDALR